MKLIRVNDTNGKFLKYTFTPSKKAKNFCEDFYENQKDILKNDYLKNKLYFLVDLLKVYNTIKNANDKKLHEKIWLGTLYLSIWSDFLEIQYWYDTIFSKKLEGKLEDNKVSKIVIDDIIKISDFQESIAKIMFNFTKKIEIDLTNSLKILANIYEVDLTIQNILDKKFKFPKYKKKQVIKNKLEKTIYAIVKSKGSNCDTFEIIQSLDFGKKIFLFQYLYDPKKLKSKLFSFDMQAFGWTRKTAIIDKDENFIYSNLREINRIRNWVSHHESLFRKDRLNHISDTISNFDRLCIDESENKKFVSKIKKKLIKEYNDFKTNYDSKFQSEIKLALISNFFEKNNLFKK